MALVYKTFWYILQTKLFEALVMYRKMCCLISVIWIPANLTLAQVSKIMIAKSTNPAQVI